MSYCLLLQLKSYKISRKFGHVHMWSIITVTCAGCYVVYNATCAVLGHSGLPQSMPQWSTLGHDNAISIGFHCLMFSVMPLASLFMCQFNGYIIDIVMYQDIYCLQ